MVNNWGEQKFGDVIDVTDYVANGSFAALKENVSYSEEVDYAILVRLVDFNAGWKGKKIFVPRESYDFLRKSSLTPGDVIIANVGANAGTVFRVPDLGQPMTLGPNAVLVRPKKDSEEARTFLYYSLVGPRGQENLKSILGGSAQPKFNKTDLRSLRFSFPDNAEQVRIAHILGTLDNKIELNRRQNETLDSLVRALFQSWFVDFDPVRAKANGETEAAICQRLGLSPQVLALFPAALVDSALGQVPVGWEVKPFSQLVQIIGGGTPKTTNANYWDGEINWFSVVDVPPGADVYVIDTQKKITESGLVNSSARLLPPNTTIISARGTVGKVVLTGLPMAMNQSCYALKSQVNTPYFIFLVTRYLADILKQHSHGTVFDTITRDTFSRVSFVSADISLLYAFDETLAPFLQTMLRNQQESRILSALRDELLPRLLSGEMSTLVNA